MFTGIVEALGSVKDIIKRGSSAELSIAMPDDFKDCVIGDSVAVNGACLTISRKSGSIFFFDVSSETLDKTTLGSLRIGEKVNLERAIRADGRFGGHFVTGHVDCVGKIIGKLSMGQGAWSLEFEAPESIQRYLVEKGSIAVDGISLTIVKLKPFSFIVAVISHTIKNTNLSIKGAGSKVNLEADMLAKYAEKFISKTPTPKLTEAFLKEHGF